MKKLVFTTADACCGNLILVNRRHPLAVDIQQGLPLVSLGAGPDGREVLLAGQAAKMMRHLVASAGGEGQILPVSGYRSRAEQTELFTGTLREKGEAFTRRYVAVPGCSEHETGLALDVAAAEKDFDYVCPSFPDSGVYRRFRLLAASCGYVERYPEDKCEVTGIGYEPWHFRYVGWPHSAIMVQKGWTLEEYVEVLAGYTSLEDALIYREGGYRCALFTLPVQSGEQTELLLPENAVWQASGNNDGGVVVTVWV